MGLAPWRMHPESLQKLSEPSSSSQKCDLSKSPETPTSSVMKAIKNETNCAHSCEVTNSSPKRMVRGVCGSPNFWSNHVFKHQDSSSISSSDSRHSPSPRRDVCSKYSPEKYSLRRGSISPKRSEKPTTIIMQNQLYFTDPPKQKNIPKVSSRKAVSVEKELNLSPFGGGGIIDKWGNPISPPPHPPRATKKKTVTRVIKACSVSPGRPDRSSRPCLSLTGGDLKGFSSGSEQELKVGDSYLGDTPSPPTSVSFPKLSSGSSSDSGCDSSKEEKKKQLVLHLPPSSGLPRSAHHHKESGRDRSHKKR